jgi:glycosyltransferase involved in cell wall biosynthesis
VNVPPLTIVIPTRGRNTLAFCLASLQTQPEYGEIEVIVVGDTHSEPQPAAEKLAKDSGARYLAHDGGQHSWGAPQANAGYRAATGRYIALLGDDDVSTPGALAAILAAIEAEAEPRPLLFKCRVRDGRELPRNGVAALGEVSGQCLVTPNDPERLGVWPEDGRYENDWAFIADTLQRWMPIGPRWFETVIASQ